MLKAISRQLKFNLAYAKELVVDVTKDEMTHSPCTGLENHPAFTLGHLVMSRALAVKYLGGTFCVPKTWEALFMRKGPGDNRLPKSDIEAYPSKKELLVELEKQGRLLSELLENQSAKALLDQEKEWRFNTYMPSVLDCTIFMCINHEAMHLGQLAAWRRAVGKKAALAKL